MTLPKDGSLLVFTSGVRGSTSFPCLLKAISFDAKGQIGLEKYKTLARNGEEKVSHEP